MIWWFLAGVDAGIVVAFGIMTLIGKRGRK